MKSVTWPSSLPAPTVVGYGITPGDGVQRTQMDSGLARQRRLFTQTPTGIAVAWLLTTTEFQTFEGWYQHFAREGAAFFTIDLASGTGIISHTVRFKGVFRATLMSQTLWRVTAELETVNRPVVSEGYLKIALESDLDALYAGVDRYGQILEVTIPEAA